MSTTELTPEQRAQAQQLAADHADLQQQLMDLNNELDDLLSRRGQGLSRVLPVASKIGGGPRATGHSQAEKLAARNEQQRRINEELTLQLSVVDAIAKTDDLKQRVATLTQQCEALRAENRSLENVYAHQHQQTSADDRFDEDVRRARAEHSDEVHRLREATRQLKEAREQAMVQYRALQRAEGRAELKLKAQDAGAGSLDELRAAVAERDDALKALRDEILALSKASGDRQRARARTDRLAREYEELVAEAERLREQASHVP